MSAACTGANRSAATQPAAAELQADIVNSAFPEAHDTYNGISCASDGRIYYVLSSEKAGLAAQMYSYDPSSKAVKHLGDLTEECGEKDAHAISQGKSHVRFVESEGKLYFATHIGFYSIIDGMEKPGTPPPGLYGLSWPTGRFLRYDIPKHEMKDLGPVSEQGENGKGPTFRTICRSLAVDPSDGTVYFSTSDGAIHGYHYDSEAIDTVATDDLKKDYFGLYDPTSAGHMGYNWRQTFWYGPENAIYGVHGNSGYLFRFAPAAGQVEVLGRITSEVSQRSGMFDQFSYGYLGFALGSDNRTIYYLTGGPVYENGRRVRGKDSTAKGESKGLEDLHLVTWHIPTGRYIDHGPIFFASGQRPNYVNSIAVGKDGAVYALSRVSEDPHAITDLMRIPPVPVQ